MDTAEQVPLCILKVSGSQMLLLTLALGVQTSGVVSLPVEAYGADDGWNIRVGRNGVLYRVGDLDRRIARYFRPARITTEGARTVFATSTAEGRPVVLTIEPGSCRTSGGNQTALLAQLEIEDRRLTGCAEDGGEDRVPESPPMIGDYFLDDGIQATGRDRGWELRVGGLGGTMLAQSGHLTAVAGSPQPMIARGVATYNFVGEDQRAVTATARVARCALSNGETYPLTVEVRAGGATLRGCGWTGNLPPVLVPVGDGGSDAQLRAGEIDNDHDYPHEARRAGASGAVAVFYVVGANGRVTACDIVESSGNAELDSATCRLVQTRYRFEPARDPSGLPRETIRHFRIVWRLPAR